MAENKEQMENLEGDQEPAVETSEAELAAEEESGAALDALSPEELKEKVKQLQAQNEDYLTRLQRLQADFDNFRRRNRQEREDLVRVANENLINGLLPVIDNMERALAVEGEAANLKTGVEMVFRSLMEVLGNAGLQPMEAIGQEFDPNCHQAVMMEASAEFADNQICAELQKGYFLKDKVLRPAMVKVAQN